MNRFSFFYPKVLSIDNIVDQVTQDDPSYDFIADDGIRHRVWLINQPQVISTLSDLFTEKVPSLYIADGHHRTAAGALTGRELRQKRNGTRNDGGRDNYLMAVAFPDTQLKILDYNRVVKDLNGLTQQEFLAKIAMNFTIEKKPGPYRPDALHYFGMYLNGCWYKIKSQGWHV